MSHRGWTRRVRGAGWVARACVLLACAASAGCEGASGRPPEPSSAKRTASASAAELGEAGEQGGSQTEAPRSRATPPPARLVAIGDVHGDLAATRAALRLGGAIDASDAWVGGELVLVQTGDQLDRGDDERAILDLFASLEQQAKAAGGRFVALNGNHETMNVQGDYRYVTPAGLTAFAGVTPESQLASLAPRQFRTRAAAFLPGGAYARVLAGRDVIAVIGDSAFVHGGVLPEHVSYGIERINREVREWMLGEALHLPAAVASERAPVWVRDYSLDPVSPETCARLKGVLEALGVARMIVGHTTQKSGITSACDERVYRIDVGLSSYYGSGPVQVLEVTPDGVRVLSAPR